MHQQAKLSAAHGVAFAQIKTQIHGVTEVRKIVKDRVMENTLMPTHLSLRAAVHGGLGNVANLKIRGAIGNEQIVKVHVREFGSAKSKASC